VDWKNSFKPISLRDFSIGLLTGIGFTKFWLLSDGLLARTALPYRKPPISIWIISIVPLLTIFWSLDPLACVLWFWRVHVIYNSYSKVQDRKSLIWGVGIVLIIQLFIAMLENDIRPRGLTDNPQRYAMISWAMIGTNPFLSVLGGANIGISTARLALFSLIGAAIWTRQHAIVFAAVLGITLFVFFTPDDRHNFTTFNEATTTRIQLVTGQSNNINNDVKSDSQTAAIVLDRPDLIGKAKKDQEGNYIRPWLWHGYGYGSFNDYTGLSKPHNSYLLIWYDLGIFSVVFLLAVFWFGLITIRKPFWLLFATGSYMFFVDDFFGLPVGLYVIAFQFYMVSGIKNIRTKRMVVS